VVFDLFGKQDLVDDEAGRWLLDTFGWCLRNFDADVFHHETRLVIPSNEHFPGRENSVEGMARLIFDHVKGYAGMQHWPWRLTNPETCLVQQPVRLEIQGPLRGSKAVSQRAPEGSASLSVVYDPALVGNPEALIAGYAHTLAHYLGQTAQEAPPGGAANWPQATEVLAVFMGFGLMFANSAFTTPVRSCGSCGPSSAQRRSYLTQYESTYALALFSVLKDISNKTVTAHLKKPLRPFYRKCVREVKGKQEALARLRSIRVEPAPRATAAVAVSS
jgi:hypothetical protein